MRVVQQMATEGMLLATGGGLLGIGFGYLALKNLLASMPVGVPREPNTSIANNVLVHPSALVNLSGPTSRGLPARRTPRAPWR